MGIFSGDISLGFLNGVGARQENPRAIGDNGMVTRPANTPTSEDFQQRPVASSVSHRLHGHVRREFHFL